MYKDTLYPGKVRERTRGPAGERESCTLLLSSEWLSELGELQPQTAGFLQYMVGQGVLRKLIPQDMCIMEWKQKGGVSLQELCQGKDGRQEEDK